jgi:hypothetical protein
MPCCCHWHHCPYHNYHHYWPGWADAYPPPAFGSPPPGSERDEYIRRLESERGTLEQRLRRLEDQLVELQRERASKG